MLLKLKISALNTHLLGMVIYHHVSVSYHIIIYDFVMKKNNQFVIKILLICLQKKYIIHYYTVKNIKLALYYIKGK